MKRTLGLVLVIMLSLPLYAEVRFANIFSSNGIIQHGKPISVWGLGDPGEKVILTLNGFKGCKLSQRKEGVADRHGKWIVTLDPLTAGDNFHMSVQGTDSKDASYQMQAGDVWFYAGYYRFRSMRYIPQITTEGWKEDNEDLFPLLRLYGTSEKNVMPQRRENGIWREPAAYYVFGFSPGIAVHFGIELCRNKNIPIGIVYVASLYGHWIDEYLSAEGVVHDPVLGKTDDARKLSYLVGGTAECKQMNAARTAYMAQYLAQSIKRSADNKTVLHPDYPQIPEEAETKTSLFYNGAIHPMLPMAIKGVIFNDPNGAKPFYAETHGAKLALLVSSFRIWFDDPALPVVIMQDHAYRHQNTIRATPRFAAQQQLAQKDPHVAIAVTHDIEVFDKVDELLLKTISAKGHRAYQMADRLAYGNGTATIDTPYVMAFTSTNGNMTLTFSMPLRTFDGLAPDGFALKEKGHSIYRKAIASLEGNTIILSSPMVENPEHANYGYVNRAIKNAPNVIGKNKMPVPAFSTELLPKTGDEE